MENDVEPIRAALSVRLGPLKMYREDIEQLVGIFEKACRLVTISDRKNRYKSIDAMQRTVSSPLKDFTIQGDDPDVTFVFNRMEVVTGTASPEQRVFNDLRQDFSSDPADALYYKVKDFLLQHQRPTIRKAVAPFTILSFLAIFVVAGHYDATVPGGPPRMYPQGWPLLILSFIIFFILLISTISVRNYVTLEKKRNSPGFFTKNREDLLKDAIKVVLGGIIGWAIAHFSK
jgi:hypothetical protein